MRKLIASVALVTAVAVGGLAVTAVNPLQMVSATSSTKTTAPTTTTAKAKVKATAKAKAASKWLDKALAGLVEKGTITKDQAAAVKSALQTSAKQARGARKHKGPLRKALRGGVVKTSAKSIGITPKDLVAGLKSGKSIAQVAQAKGVDPKTVVSAIVTAGNTKIDAAVKAGKLKAERATKLEQRLPELATKAVNRVPKQRTN